MQQYIEVWTQTNRVTVVNRVPYTTAQLLVLCCSFDINELGIGCNDFGEPVHISVKTYSERAQIKEGVFVL